MYIYTYACIYAYIYAYIYIYMKPLQRASRGRAAAVESPLPPPCPSVPSPPSSAPVCVRARVCGLCADMNLYK